MSIALFFEYSGADFEPWAAKKQTSQSAINPTRLRHVAAALCYHLFFFLPM